MSWTTPRMTRLVMMPRALLQSIPFEPGLDTEMAAHALQAFIYDSGRLVLAEPGRYPPERVVAYSRTAFRWLMAD
jgi:hypothetical protein